MQVRAGAQAPALLFGADLLPDLLPDGSAPVVTGPHRRSIGTSARLVLAGRGPYTADQVSAQLDCEVLATIADDAGAARVLAEGGGSKSLARSPLLRSTRSLAALLAGRAVESSGAASAEPMEVRA